MDLAHAHHYFVVWACHQGRRDSRSLASGRGRGPRERVWVYTDRCNMHRGDLPDAAKDRHLWDVVGDSDWGEIRDSSRCSARSDRTSNERFRPNTVPSLSVSVGCEREMEGSHTEGCAANLSPG